MPNLSLSPSFSPRHYKTVSSNNYRRFQITSFSDSNNSTPADDTPPEQNEPDGAPPEPNEPDDTLPEESANNEKMYQVESGSIFRTFSYNNKEGMVGISGFNSGFKIDEGHKVYIEFDILSNLQVSGANIKCSKVGKESPDYESDEADVEGWPDFPNMFRIVPKDEVNEDGLIIKRVDGKRQTKAYLLLGLRDDDEDIPENKPEEGEEEKKKENDDDSKSFSVLQKFSSNAIMMISQVSGVPVVFPMPWIPSLEKADNFP
jgi:hypothetical protein